MPTDRKPSHVLETVAHAFISSWLYWRADNANNYVKYNHDMKEIPKGYYVALRVELVKLEDKEMDANPT